MNSTANRQSFFTPRIADAIAISFLILLPLLFFWRETLGRTTLGDQDAVFWFFPAYKFVAEQLRQGNLPLWTPYLYCGSPLLAGWQAGVFDPINWIYLFGVTSRTLTLSLQVSFALSLLATFSYARTIGFKRRASVVSAVIYALGGLAVGRTLYPGFLHIIALAPLVLAFTERLARRGRWRDCIGGALIVAWQVFAAHPQPLIYSSLLACAYALFRLRSAECGMRNAGDEFTGESKLRTPHSALRTRIRFLAQFALMFLAGSALAAIQLLPSAEFARESVRQVWPYELFTLHSLHPVSLLTALFPFFHGGGQSIYRMPFWGPYWHHNEAQIYLGALALALAIAAAICGWKLRLGLPRFWSLVAVVGTVLALGQYSGPVARALFQVPVISQFRGPNRHWMEVALAVAVLAGYAVDRLLDEPSREASKFIARWAAMVSLALALLCVVVGGFMLWERGAAESLLRSFAGLQHLQPGFLQHAGPEFSIPMIASLCACGAILVFARRRSYGYWLLLVLLLADFNLYAAFAPISNPEKLETLVGRAMPDSLVEKQSERDPIRYQVMLSAASGEFNPFWFYGHEMATGYDPILNERVKTFLGMDEAGRTFDSTMLDAANQTLDLLNVRYVLVPPVNFGEATPRLNALGDSVDLKSGARAVFKSNDARSDQLTIVSSLSNSAGLADGEPVAEAAIACGSGDPWINVLRAGRDTSEWAYDRADVRGVIQHKRAPVAENRSGDARGSFQAHTYLARIQLPDGLKTCRAARTVTITATARDGASITIARVAFSDSASGKTATLARSVEGALSDASRWRELAVRSDVHHYRGYRIYENLRAMPRAWLVDRVVVDWEGDQLKKIRGQLPGFDPREAVLADSVTAARLTPSLVREPDEFKGMERPIVSIVPMGKADIIRREPTRMMLEATAERQSVLALSEIFYPGWHVSVDGREAELLRVNYNLRGVELSAGKHRIEMSYRPRSVVAGAVVSITTALCLLAIWVWERRRLRDAGALALPSGLLF